MGGLDVTKVSVAAVVAPMGSNCPTEIVSTFVTR